ncbi:MAG: oxidoreductase [Magnetococcales bacterium]|nr:oxidoreductase [Magnetococcales bacterium]
MNPTPPALIPFHGDWSKYVEEVYQAFLDDVVNGVLTIDRLPVSCQFRPPSQGKHFAFWHMVSEGKQEEDRIPDFRRCERIRWIAWVISNHRTHPDISWWKNRRGSNTMLVLWYEPEDFAVILAERKGYWLLKTAYLLQGHRKKTFAMERDEYWRTRNG